jgi:hypothetical protein
MTTITAKRQPGVPAWFDLATPDLNAVKPFYQSVLGWDYFDMGADFGHYHFALVGGRNVAGMGSIPEGAQMPSAWTMYWASDNAAADAARVKSLGGQILNDAMTVGDSGTMAICADPTGAIFGLWQAGMHIGASAVDEPGAMAWCEVNTGDAAAARDFYCALFGINWQPMEGMVYYMLAQGEKIVAGVLQMDENWAGIPPHWMCYFAVENTDAAIERATAAGGQAVVPAFDSPYGRIAVLRDPCGATFSIIKLA